MISDKLVDQLIRDEGEVHHLYKCSAGKWTIGIGRNLEDNGISHEESVFLLQNDLKRTYNELRSAFDWFERLSIVRASVLINMCFNLGSVRLGTFKKTLRHIEYEEWEYAAREMLDSKWARQVGKRAVRLSEQMRSGKWN